MTEEEYINTIVDMVSETDSVTVEAVELIEQAVREHPNSAFLWRRRGDLIQLGPESTSHTLEDALSSYYTALKLDPGNADILEDIGHFYDVIMSNEVEAAKWFNKAKKMKRDNNGIQ